jgi:hypothetical protein
MKSARKEKESQIQRDIMDTLEIYGFTHWRNFTGPIIHRNKIFCKNKNAGMPDILGICKTFPGRLFAIEVKTKIGKVAEEQTEWIARLNEAGAVAFVARDIETVLGYIREQKI